MQFTPEVITAILTALGAGITGGGVFKIVEWWGDRRKRRADADGHEAEAAGKEVDAVTRQGKLIDELAAKISKLQKERLDQEREMMAKIHKLQEERQIQEYSAALTAKQVESLEAKVRALESKVASLSSGLPPRDYHAVRILLPQAASIEMVQTVMQIVHPLRRTVTRSVDDACIGRLSHKLVIGVGFAQEQWQIICTYAEQHYPNTELHQATLDELRADAEAELGRKRTEEGWPE